MTGPAPAVTRAPSAWGRIGRGKRLVIVVVVGVVGLNLLSGVLKAVTGGDDPGGPAGSSFATAPGGVAAWADLLDRRGVPVERLRSEIGPAALAGAGTVIVVEPERMTPDEAGALAAFAVGGGRVVVVGQSAADLVTALTGADRGWSSRGVPGARALVPVDVTAGVGRTRSPGIGSWQTPGDALPVVGGPDGATVVVVPVGEGEVVAVADAAVVENRWLGEADNAALAVGLAGDGPVVFAESVHGYAGDVGWSSLPVSIRWWVVAMVVCGLLAVWVFGQRFGPPEVASRPLPPPRAAYVEAVTGALVRRGDVAGASASVRAEGRRLLLDRTGLPGTAPDDALREAALAAGVAPPVVDAVLGPPPHDDTALVAAAAAVGALRSRA